MGNGTQCASRWRHRLAHCAIDGGVFVGLIASTDVMEELLSDADIDTAHRAQKTASTAP
jgi:hypothetical protein